MKTKLIVPALAALMIMTSLAFAEEKKVLYVDSYHEGYAWSDGIHAGIKDVLDGKVDLKVIRMDTNRKNEEEAKMKAAAEIKAVIDEWKPDVVIASDDNASKYLVVPHLKDIELPVVFCGVNWDAAVYGYPTKTITGMIEVTPITGLLEQLSKFAKGDKIGFLAPDIITGHREAENIKKAFGLEMEEYFAKDKDDWMAGFKTLQDKVDILIIDSDGGLYNDFRPELTEFALKNTKIPTGACYDFISDYAMITYAKVPEEQGQWAADAALRILDGQSPADIPVTQNSQGTLVINAKIIQSSGLDVPFEIIQSANKVIE
jgi:ABC-type uncharacterized transport system substrate-binding protein